MIALQPTFLVDSNDPVGSYSTTSYPVEPTTMLAPQPTPLQPIALVEPVSGSQEVVKAVGTVMTQPAPTQPQTLPAQQEPVYTTQNASSTVATASPFDWRSVPVWVWALVGVAVLSVFTGNKRRR